MRKLPVMFFILCILICILAAVADTAFASAPSGEFAPLERSGATATPPPAKQTPTQCIMVDASPCHATGIPVLYAFHPGETIKIKGQKWATKATIVLYLVDVAGATANSGQAQPGNSALCPAAAALVASSITRSPQQTTDARGAFSVQLKLPTTLKINTTYNMCISVNTSGHANSRLLLQLYVQNSSQQQTGGVVPHNNLTFTTTSVAPSSYALTFIALALAVIALLLFFLSPRQAALPRPDEKGDVL
jgi:hypothetical protein